MDVEILTKQARELRPEQMSRQQINAVIETAIKYNGYIPRHPAPCDEVLVADARLLVGYARVIRRLGAAGTENSPGISDAIIAVYEGREVDKLDHSGVRG